MALGPLKLFSTVTNCRGSRPFCCSRTQAWLQGRDYVDPEDVRAVVHDCLRHRLGLSYAAEGEGIRADQVIDEVIKRVALP